MAVTKLYIIRAVPSMNILSIVDQHIRYVVNPQKTQNGELVTSHCCRHDADGAIEDFTNNVLNYYQHTQTNHRHEDRLIYHIIQSFKHEEVESETANR